MSVENIFLLNYLPRDGAEDEVNRLIAVRAALEIAKASISSATGSSGAQKCAVDMKQVAEQIGSLADAIQAAIHKN